MKSSSATSRMRVRVSCWGLTARRDMGGGQYSNERLNPSPSGRAASRARRLFLAVARGRLADEGLLLVLVLDLVGDQQVELGLVFRLHGRALDHHPRHRADVLGEPALGALEDLEGKTARRHLGGDARELG